jgi:hypothetical protein
VRLPLHFVPLTPHNRLNLGCEGSAVQICPFRPLNCYLAPPLSFLIRSRSGSAAVVPRASLDLWCGWLCVVLRFHLSSRVGPWGLRSSYNKGE